MRSLILSCLVLLSVYSCKVKEPIFKEITDFRLESITDSTVLADVTVLVHNPSNITYKTNEISYTLSYKNTVLGTGISANKVEFPRKSDTTLSNKIQFNMDSLILYLDDFMRVDTIPVSFKIETSLQKPEIPISREFTIYVPTDEMLKRFLKLDKLSEFIKPTQVKMKALNMQYSEFSAVMEFTNPYPFDFTVQASQIQVFQNKNDNTAIGTWDLQDTVVIKKDSIAYIPVTVKIDNLKSFTGLFTKVMTMDSKFYLKGTAAILIKEKQFTVPLRFTVDVMKF